MPCQLPPSCHRRPGRRRWRAPVAAGVLAAVALVAPPPAAATTIDDPGPLVSGTVQTLTGTCASSSRVEVVTPWNLFPSLWDVTDGRWTGNVMVSSSEGPVTVTATCGRWDGAFVPEEAATSIVVQVVEADFRLDLTVGTEPGACATDAAVTVARGTTVHWCATAHNLTGHGFGSHTVTSTIHGPLAEGLSHALAHGASVDTVELGIDASSVADEALEATVEWTMTGPDGEEQSATATARVEVTDAPPTTPSTPSDGPDGSGPSGSGPGRPGATPTPGAPTASPATPVVGTARLTG